MKGLPWFPKYVGDFRRKTSQLSMLEKSAYNDLLDEYYANGGPLLSNATSIASLMPDHSRLYRLCGATSKAEQDAVDCVISQFFIWEKDRGYVNTKADEVIAKQQETHSRRVEAGRLGGKKKASSNAKAKPKPSSSNQNQNQYKDNTNVLSPPEVSMLFENVWQAYPGRGREGRAGNGFKGSKAEALKSFSKIVTTAKDDHEALVRNIIEGASRYSGHLERSGYPSKHASTWLNQRGWEDDYTSTPGSPSPGGGKPSKHDRARDVLLGGDDSVIVEG